MAVGLVRCGVGVSGVAVELDDELRVAPDARRLSARRRKRSSAGSGGRRSSTSRRKRISSSLSVVASSGQVMRERIAQGSAARLAGAEHGQVREGGRGGLRWSAWARAFRRALNSSTQAMSMSAAIDARDHQASLRHCLNPSGAMELQAARSHGAMRRGDVDRARRAVANRSTTRPQWCGSAPSRCRRETEQRGAGPRFEAARDLPAYTPGYSRTRYPRVYKAPHPRLADAKAPQLGQREDTPLPPGEPTDASRGD